MPQSSVEPLSNQLLSVLPAYAAVHILNLYMQGSPIFSIAPELCRRTARQCLERANEIGRG